MRLVDVDLLIDRLAKEPVETRTYYRANEIAASMPTAYDVDKVMEKLEGHRRENEPKSYMDITNRLVYTSVHLAIIKDIDIVKSGGIE